MQKIKRWLGGPVTLRETIESHANNYTLVRLLLATSVIYFHSFPLSGMEGRVDHLSAWMWPVTDVGGLAVKLFFFLSGLFVTQSFHRNTDVVGFAVRRFLRIWPALFICLLVTSLLLVALTGTAPLWRYFQFAGLYDYVVRNSAFHLTWEISGVLQQHKLHTVNGPIHTLPMEAKMYVVLAFIGVAGMVRTRRRIILAGIASLVLLSLPQLDALLSRYLFDASWSKTAGAMFMAGVLAYGVSPWLRPAPWQGALLLPAACFSTGFMHELFFYASAVWLMLLVGQSYWLGKIWRPREDLSYGIYLYGWPCQQMVLAVTARDLDPYLLTILATALASVFALLSWRIFEKPAMAFGKGISAKTWWQVPKPNRGVIVVLSLLLAMCLGMRWMLWRWDFLPVVQLPAAIVDFGPHESRAGKAINRQPDGGSAIWLKLDGDPGNDAVVVMDGHHLESQSGPGSATARVKRSILARPGDKEIYLERRLPDHTERSNSVSMRITP
ncbi:hypothetical protein ASF01_15990 [Stenotrophomonas sp. Leaf70]|uniref:acyltransferase family protein n=1 Tax=Stenotrophomonas sp. Leaf70 TaxID=1736233 RepID=UPI0006FEF1D6|nr:acyltransferase [Stenotrophomonas sp. Leaf70]KQN95867.1 hypothetical protein ASF01_15990 [Stenotrophomonas sp. Leaf70]